MHSVKIYGAGIAGLLAGCVFPTARIYEAEPQTLARHKAVLRFRSSAVGDAVGIDFRRVQVRKGIWTDGHFVEPNIALANAYSLKVIGKLVDRSIWDIQTAERWIAPEYFIERLVERCESRIEFDHPVNATEFLAAEVPSISTIPMSVVHKMLQPSVGVLQPVFSYEPIVVRRWRVPNADVFQTVYFPNPATTLYRMSITGDLLIAEYIKEDDGYVSWSAFGLEEQVCEPIESTMQRFGKIAPIDDTWRKSFIFNLTQRHGVFSLGRFGTWRNILLDDVIQDLTVIKKLLGANAYDLSRKTFAGGSVSALTSFPATKK